VSTIAIKIEGTDITADVILADATFTTSIGAFPGQFDIRVKDPTAAYDFKASDNITLDIDGIRSFDGYVFQASKEFAFYVVDTSQQPQVLMWHLRGVDVNILFQKRYVYKASNPKEKPDDFPVGTTDQAALTTLFTDFLDLAGDGLTTSFSEVGVITPDEKGLPFALGDIWQTAMLNISQLPGGVFGIRPDRTVFYEDDDTESAPFRLSDTPNNTTSFGYSDMDWVFDGTKLANDSLFWGAGLGSSRMVISRVQDAASIADHGRWQSGILRGDVYRQTTANLISNSIVYGSPQNLHGGKDDSQMVTCRVKKPGLTPGDKVHITSNVFGISKVLPIRNMTMTFPTPTDALYDLQLSYEIDRPLSYHNFPKIPRFRLPGLPPIWSPPPPSGCGDCGITDTFTRVTDSGWGMADAGFNWTADSPAGTSSSVNGTQGVLTSDSSEIAMFTSTLPAGAFTASCRFSVDHIPPSATDLFANFHIFGMDGATARWFFEVTFSDAFASGTGYGRVVIGNSGVGGTQDYDNDRTFTADVDYIAKLYWDGVSTVSAKVWLASDPEPGSWEVTATITAPATSLSLDWADDPSNSAPDSIFIEYLDVTDFNRCTEFRFDNFRRVVVPNWGTSDFLVEWVRGGIGQATGSVDGGKGIIKLIGNNFDASGNYNIHVDASGRTDLWMADGGYTMLMLWDVVGDMTVERLRLRFDDQDSADRQLTLDIGGDQIQVFWDTATQSSPVTSVNYSDWINGTMMYVKWEVVPGTSNKVRVWNIDDPEPSSWLIDIDDGPTDPLFFFNINFDSSNQAITTDHTAQFEFIDFDYDGKACYLGAAGIDDFNRVLPDGTPAIGTDSAGSWGTASCGAVWDINVSSENAYFGVGSSVGGGLQVGRYIRESRVNHSLSPGEWSADLYPVPPPIGDEPILSLKVRMPSIIPDGVSDRGPLKLQFRWETDGSFDELNFGIAVSSESGKGGIAIRPGSGDTLTGSATLSKINWVGGAMYQIEAQFLHSGIVQMRVWRLDLESRPDWQVSWDSGGDYNSWSLSGLFRIFCRNYNTHDTGGNIIESMRVEFEDITMGDRVVGPSAGSPGTPEAGSFGCEAPTVISDFIRATTYEFISGTLDVYLNGTRQRPGVDYFEDPDHKHFYFGRPVVAESVYCCYMAIGK